MLLQNRMKALTVTGSVLALGAGTLAGMAPAQAASSGTTVTCPDGSEVQAAEVVGGSVPTWGTEQDVPKPFHYGIAAGSPDEFEQAAGDTVVHPKTQVNGVGNFQNVPDGRYVVSWGDGVCGGTQFASVKGGALDTSSIPGLDRADGDQMLRIFGPVAADSQDPRHPVYLDQSMGKTTQPMIEEAGVFRAHADSLTAVRPDDQAAIQSMDQLPVVTKGSASIPLTSDQAPEHLRDGTEVKALTVAEKKYLPVVVADGLHLKEEGGGLSIEGDAVKSLPTGRYAFQFKDSEGTKYTVYAMVGEHDEHQADQSFWGPANLNS